jgi:hypothetical protein
MKAIKKKKATILPENVIFIILNVLFLAILIIFITKQGSGVINLEESYAKQICLLIDSAEPVSVIKLNMEKARKVSEKNNVAFENIIKINEGENIVTVRLSSDSGYSYSFFKNVDVVAFPDGEVNSVNYMFTITEK